MSNTFIELIERPKGEIWTLGFHRWSSLSESQLTALMVKHDFDYDRAIKHLEGMGDTEERLSYYVDSAAKDVENNWLEQGKNLKDLWIEETDGSEHYCDEGQDLFIEIRNKQDAAVTIYKEDEWELV